MSGGPFGRPGRTVAVCAVERRRDIAALVRRVGVGSLCLTDLRLDVTRAVAIDFTTNGNDETSVALTLPSGRVVSTTAGHFDGSPGLASGGDININGASTANSSGTAAPSYDTFQGGAAPASNKPGNSPGGGAAAPSGLGFYPGGGALVLVTYIGP